MLVTERLLRRCCFSSLSQAYYEFPRALCTSSIKVSDHFKKADLFSEAHCDLEMADCEKNRFYRKFLIKRQKNTKCQLAESQRITNPSAKDDIQQTSEQLFLSKNLLIWRYNHGKRGKERRRNTDYTTTTKFNLFVIITESSEFISRALFYFLFVNPYNLIVSGRSSSGKRPQYFSNKNYDNHENI